MILHPYLVKISPSPSGAMLGLVSRAEKRWYKHRGGRGFFFSGSCVVWGFLLQWLPVVCGRPWQVVSCRSIQPTAAHSPHSGWLPTGQPWSAAPQPTSPSSRLSDPHSFQLGHLPGWSGETLFIPFCTVNPRSYSSSLHLLLQYSLESLL